MTSLHELTEQMRQRLSAVYDTREADWVIRIVIEHLLNYTPVDIVIRRDEPVIPFIIDKADKIVDRLLTHEPIQYIIGEARFCGMTFEVTTATLIPRPETEELVDTITRQWKRVPDATVLDLGTGSGCIAIALARALRFPKVTAIDISAEALNVARKNAAAYRCHIDFRQADMLHLPPESNCMDIIVSNPPYIADSERTSMSANVLDFEPHSALFVPDSDPLLFYTAIARYASTALTQRGALYMEINPLFVGQLRQMLSHYGFADVTILADMQGRQRIAVAHRS